MLAVILIFEVKIDMPSPSYSMMSFRTTFAFPGQHHRVVMCFFIGVCVCSCFGFLFKTVSLYDMKDAGVQFSFPPSFCCEDNVTLI